GPGGDGRLRLCRGCAGAAAGTAGVAVVRPATGRGRRPPLAAGDRWRRDRGRGACCRLDRRAGGGTCLPHRRRPVDPRAMAVGRRGEGATDGSRLATFSGAYTAPVTSFNCRRIG